MTVGKTTFGRGQAMLPDFNRLRKLENSLLVNAPRDAAGSSTVELIAAIGLLIPVALLALNIAFLAFGAFYNDAACREGARAASRQSSEEAARIAATNAVKSYEALGIGKPAITQFEFNFKNSPPDSEAPLSNPSTPIELRALKPDADPTLAKGAGTGNGGEAPNVVVETTLSSSLPVPLLIGENGLTGRIDLRSRSVFPLLAGVKDSNGGNDSAPEDEPPPEPDDAEPPVDADPAP